MKLAIVGSRSITKEGVVAEAIEHFKLKPGIIVSGGARGVDRMAAKYARENRIPLIEFKPDYERYGRAAPILRNTTIIEHSDVVLAIHDGVSRGTLDSIRKARELGKRMCIFRCSHSSDSCKPMS
ncbi:MAG: DUF2493 domain-containing protein [Bacteroidales bacterium]|nr:DUF2493 domain-containing protein [Bacteroidales bacterium]